MTKEDFLSECVFAKTVFNSDGMPAILIAGTVFELKGHLGAAHTELFVTALRNSVRREETTEGANAAKFYSGFDDLKGE